jgi:PiT family inorganic phosphate transporter
MIWFFLLSGLFLGWSLGANDAANIFGTAVGSRMVRFRVAALVASLGVIAGAVVGGAGTSGTLGSLGAVNAVGGSFTVALMAGVSVAWMNRLGIPVSTSQAVVGAIIGWNLFTGSPTDLRVLTTIVTAWVASPIIAAVVAVLLFQFARWSLNRFPMHLLEVDAWTRAALIVVGGFGAYSLGANNIGNVMGVFVPASPFETVRLGWLEISGVQQLFMLGGCAIALGIWTDSRRVMETVGSELFRLTPIMALVVVLAHSIALFLFASTGLRALLMWAGLPTIPLVPVSSSQAIIGAVLGVALAKRAGTRVQFGVLGRIAAGWLVTPIIAGVLSFVALFVMQNVFELEVVAPRADATQAIVSERPPIVP